MTKPGWTVLYNNTEGDYVGTCWEFFTDKAKAEKRFEEIHCDKNNCGCLRPYYEDCDRKHMGACYLGVVWENQ